MGEVVVNVGGVALRSCAEFPVPTLRVLGRGDHVAHPGIFQPLKVDPDPHQLTHACSVHPVDRRVVLGRIHRAKGGPPRRVVSNIGENLSDRGRWKWQPEVSAVVHGETLQVVSGADGAVLVLEYPKTDCSDTSKTIVREGYRRCRGLPYGAITDADHSGIEVVGVQKSGARGALASDLQRDVGTELPAL